MDENVRLLREIGRNCQVGAEAIRVLLENVTDEAMREEILFQRKSYQDMGREAETLLTGAGEAIEALTPAEQIGLWMGTRINTLRDKSPQHAADLLLQGSVMGLIELIRTRRKCPQASPETCALADKLTDFLRNSFQRMEQFL